MKKTRLNVNQNLHSKNIYQYSNYYYQIFHHVSQLIINTTAFSVVHAT